MSLYLSYNIEAKQERIVEASWSNTDIPVLAVATEKGRITFFQDEAINISEHDIVKDNLVTSLSWHPGEMIIAYGLVDGRVGIWIDEDNFTKEERAHESRVGIVKFNNTGSRVVSSDDKGGLIIVWRFDSQLYKLCTYKQGFNIEEILFPKFLHEKMDASKVPPQDKLNTLFFFCNSGGMLHLADDSNSSPEICRVGGKIKSLLFYERENAIIIITSHLLLVKCTIHFNQQLTPKKVKLSIAGNPENIRCTWAGEGLVAIVSGDDLVRLFYLDTDQSYFLSMSDHELGKTYSDDSFTCIDFNFRKRTLIVGSAKGKVYMWKCNLTQNIIPISSESWEAFSIVETIPNIYDIKWSNYMGLIHIYNKNSQHAMLSETILQKKMNQIMKVAQISHKTLEIILTSNSSEQVKRVEMSDSIKGLDLYNNTILTWNGISCNIFEINQTTLNFSKINSIAIKSNLLALNEDSVIAGNGKSIDIYSYEGELKNKIPIESTYGEITSFNSMDKYLLVCTSANYFGVFDIARRTLKQVLMFRNFSRNGESLGEIRDAAINCKGSYIGILADIMPNSEMRIPETKFYIFDVEIDSFTEFEISPNRIPIEILFDVQDHRLFGVQTEFAKDMNDENKNGLSSDIKPEYSISPRDDEKKEFYGSEFFIFFYTTEYGILKQESHKINSSIQGIFALNIPSIWFLVSKTNQNQQHSLVEKKFQFFQGLEKIDDQIKAALIEFSIYMSSNKLDEAYKIVKNIKNPMIWENMAAICIKTKRLDVLEVCLSNMRFTRGIKALRESKNEKEVEARLAMVAMHLGMIEEAKTLLQESNRWDVLIRFYIAIGEYEKAIQTSKDHDRIDLENTYFRIAEHYERINEIEKAIEYYRLSKCGDREIPRMLVQKGRLDLLEQYMKGRLDDVNSMLWWAAYLESQGRIEEALEYYKKAKDWTNVVRLLIQTNRIHEAKEICDDTKDQGACFLMGQYYEGIGDIKLAIYYYALSGRINQAFRLAKEHNMDNEIYNLGLKANAQTQNLIAEYFEKKGIYDKAVNLYLLAGNIKKALGICLRTNQYDKLREIADSIEYKNDKDTLRALAEYFLEQKQYEKALSLFIKLKDYDISMRICENHKVKISLQTAKAIEDDLENESDNEMKTKLTQRLAKLLMQQGEFEAAHQIYVKFENWKKAMKCLIKMGDKNRVIEFAQMCRKPELYIMAANFLQSLDWNDNEELVKTIVSFFTKAKAYINLANFYELFASVEINEFRNYEKAMVLYQEAINAIEKSKEDEEKKNQKNTVLQNKIKITKLFVHVTSIAKTDTDEALKICNQMLNIVCILIYYNIFSLELMMW
jgi:intraflagellar transport protein 140